MPRASRTVLTKSRLTSAPIWLQTGVALGAACSHSGREPHSSDSVWLKLIHRMRDGSTTFATPAITSGNMSFKPVWNSNGSSSSTTKWLNWRLISGTKTEIR